jgi:hypothetical protein
MNQLEVDTWHVIKFLFKKDQKKKDKKNLGTKGPPPWHLTTPSWPDGSLLSLNKN